MSTTELAPEHVGALEAFFASLPDGDVTFIKEELTPEVLASWTATGRRGRRWVELVDDGHGGERVVAFLAMLPLPGWSAHVGELRLVVHPDARGRGVGRRLAQLGLHEAVQLGLAKVVVEVVSAQTALIGMFTSLGFHGEALLEDHIRDRTGTVQDVVVLAHRVDEEQEAMSVTGVDAALGEGAA